MSFTIDFTSAIASEITSYVQVCYGILQVKLTIYKCRSVLISVLRLIVNITVKYKNLRQ